MTKNEIDIMRIGDIFHPEFLLKVSEHQTEYLVCLTDAIKIKLLKSLIYGEKDFANLGPKGIFADINRKYIRIKNVVWAGNKSVGESMKDTCLDLANYSIFMLMALDKKRREGNGKNENTESKE